MSRLGKSFSFRFRKIFEKSLKEAGDPMMPANKLKASESTRKKEMFFVEESPLQYFEDDDIKAFI